jgi:hypothetical protein
VKGARPSERVRHDAGIIAHHLADYSFDALRHFGGCTAGKRHQQNASGVGTIYDQVGNPVSKRVRLAGTGAGNHQQGGPRPAVILQYTMLDGPALRWIKAFEISGSRRSVHILPRRANWTVTDSRFVRNGAGKKSGGLVRLTAANGLAGRAAASATGFSELFERIALMARNLPLTN